MGSPGGALVHAQGSKHHAQIEGLAQKYQVPPPGHRREKTTASQPCMRATSSAQLSRLSQSFRKAQQEPRSTQEPTGRGLLLAVEALAMGLSTSTSLVESCRVDIVDSAGLQQQWHDGRQN
jgi:hypothetical protein